MKLAKKLTAKTLQKKGTKIVKIRKVTTHSFKFSDSVEDCSAG